MYIHTDKMHSTKCWYLTHTIRNALSFTSRPSGGFASNCSFKVCGEDSNLSWSGNSWVGGGDSLALNGPFDGAKHLPSLGALFSLTLAPWGNSWPKGKQTGVHPLWALPYHIGTFRTGLALAVHSMADFPFSQVASSFLGCWPEDRRANGSFKRAVVSVLRAPSSWPCSIVNHPQMSETFALFPGEPPIKMILHSLPAKRTCKWAKRSSRLSVIMNSEWKGVVGDCLPWKTCVFFFPLLKIHRRKYWMVHGVFCI